MGVDALCSRPLHRIGQLPCVAWLVLHLLLYVGVVALGYSILALDAGLAPDELPGALILAAVFFCPLLVLTIVAVTSCLGVLRMLSRLRRPYFRLAAILMFAMPPLLFLLYDNDPVRVVCVTVVQAATALLIVQPREDPTGWSNRDPTMEDHLR